MGIVISELHRVDGYHDRHLGTVTLNGRAFPAIVVGAFDRLESLLYSHVTAEYELSEVLSVEVNLPKNDRVSGIFALPDAQIAFDGTVHNETEVDENSSLFDLYIQNGPDFFSIDSSHLQEKPSIGTRIRIIGKGLHVYPTFT
jgi:hypothetical protein